MKRPIILLIIGLVLILIVGGLFFSSKKKPDTNQSLISTVKKVSKTDQCNKSGTTKIGSYATIVTSSKKYSLSTKESVLNYLASCDFYNNDTNQAITYATTLETLYSQNHQTTKALNETVLIKYMKNKASP